MRRYAKNTEHTLITFHIGRGGRFRNSGFKSYQDQDMPIDNYTNDLFLNFENIYEVECKIGGRENLRSLLLSAVEDQTTDSESYVRLSELGLDLGELYYFTPGGSKTDLPLDNDGTGTLEINGDYNTTIVKELLDCDKKEMELIISSNNYVSEDVMEYCTVFMQEAEDH